MQIAVPEYVGRLQRNSSEGKQITRYREVLIRHGLFVFSLAVICLLVPRMRSLLGWGLEEFLKNPLPYFLSAVGLTIFFMLMSRFYGRRLDGRQISWIFYLLCISICEEWIFRLAVPGFAAGFIGIIPAVVLSSVAFASMHYFTLRWKIKWCIFAFFGAMGLSRLMGQGDLMLVIGVHWVATFFNTPVPVGNKEFTTGKV